MAVPLHVLAIPFPAHGHLLPFLDLLRHLSSRADHHPHITVLTTPNNLSLLAPLLSTSPSIQPLTLSPPPHPLLPSHPAADTVRDLPFSEPDSFIHMIHTFSTLRSPTLAWATSLANPPTAVISDIFAGWAGSLADDLNAHHIVFSPSGASAISIFFSLWGRLPSKAASVSFPEIPHCPEYSWSQVSAIYRSYCPGEPLSEFIKENMTANLKGWGLVFNTFWELESEYLEHIQSVVGHRRVWAVGPLLPAAEAAVGRGGASSVPTEAITAWLDKWETETGVVYVCFGSQAALSAKQVAALAAGLEASRVRFVWVVRSGSILPDGFEERVEDRGLVVRGWAPQVVILSHPSVRWFLSHCGWNSMLEGLVAGVEFLAWPMTADQYTNASLLVDRLEVGVRLCEGLNTVPDPTELARMISDSVVSDGLRKARVEEIKKAAMEAVKEGGNSYKGLDELMCALKACKSRSNV